MSLVSKPFIFMRHGETELNRAHLICGATDVPLNQNGIEQAISARPVFDSLPSGYPVFSSPMNRALTTAKHALPQAHIIEEPRLAERNWGALEMRPLSEQVGYEVTPPQGESWCDFVSRVTSALNEILAHHTRPIIVAHSGVYRVIQFHLCGSPYCERIPNATPVLIAPENKETNVRVLEELPC